MEELPVINRTYEVYKGLTPILTVLPKQERYSIGQSSENSVLALLESLIMAKHAPKAQKATYLIRASAQHEIAVLKLRLILELKLANETNILKLQAKLTEVGRMLGGWRKSIQ
jgi:uncharacterized protein YehS (DUF1456 family)